MVLVIAINYLQGWTLPEKLMVNGTTEPRARLLGAESRQNRARYPWHQKKKKKTQSFVRW
jgi:hypothetical protein